MTSASVGLTERVVDPHLRWKYIGSLLRPYWRRRFARFGDGSLLYRPDWIYRADLMAIGRNVWIGPHVWLEIGGEGCSSTEPVLLIGDGASFRHHVTVSAHESILIEDDVLIAAWTSIYDSDHTLGPSGNPMWYPHRTNPVRVGKGTWIGERVSVLRGADIGCHCVIGANSVVRGSIPDYSVAVGVPARVVGSTLEMIEANR
jgi:lipopolysaccharide O-acetyltransferase